jgi:inhibitor of KinA sporulation pathway (predicted exonuclease)
MPIFKKGDWYCENCNDHQYAKNLKCRQCGHPRPRSIGNFKPGDWICQVCNGHQFASRVICRDCSTPKNENSKDANPKNANSKDANPKNTNQDSNSKEFYLVIDFEANCSSENARDHEIIEFPAVLVNAKTGETVSEFRKFVKMVNHKKLSEFIKDLTHITDEEVSNGLEWGVCLFEFEVWCHQNDITPDNTTIVTCGDWDLKTMLANQLNLTQTKLTYFLNHLFGCWNNVKIEFMKKTSNRGGMAEMLKVLDLELTGHHHSGIDDCRNIAKICHKLTTMECDVSQPNRIRDKPLWYEGKLPYRRNKKGRIMKT